MAGLLCLAPGAFADCWSGQPNSPAPSTACMYLTGAGSNVFTYYYVGPYSVQIDGTPTQVICDDFFDDSYLPEYWTADIYQGGNSSQYSSTRGSQVAQLPAGMTITQAYNEIGYLAVQLLGAANSPTPDATTIGEIHYALWSVFDPGALNVLDQYYGGSGSSHSSYYNAAYSLVQAAANYKDDNQFISQFALYSPDSTAPIICPGNTCGSTQPPQEFLVVKTPEPSLVGILGLDLSGVGALVYFLRRRKSRS